MYLFYASAVLLRTIDTTVLFVLTVLLLLRVFFILTDVAAGAAGAGTGLCRRVFLFFVFQFFQSCEPTGGVAAAVCPSGRQGGARSAWAGLRGRLQGMSPPISCVLPCPPPPRPCNTRATYRAVVNRAVSWLTISPPTKYSYGGGIVIHSSTYHSVRKHRDRFD